MFISAPAFQGLRASLPAASRLSLFSTNSRDKARYFPTWRSRSPPRSLFDGKLSNRFFGKVNLPATARMVAEIIGREEREVLSLSEGLSNSGSRQNSSRNYSRHVQERQIFRPGDLGRLKRGEFVGCTTDKGQPYFYRRFKKLSYRSLYKVGDFTSFEDKEQQAEVEDIPLYLEDHLKKIKLEAEAIVRGYPNVFGEWEEE